MPTQTLGAVTQLLRVWSDGEDGALERLTPLVEAELRRRIRWQDRAHFLGISARLVRRMLVGHARSRGYRKRGGDAQRVTLNEGVIALAEPAVDVVALDRALEALAAVDVRKSRMIELRFFGGVERGGDGGGAPCVGRHG